MAYKTSILCVVFGLMWLSIAPVSKAFMRPEVIGRFYQMQQNPNQFDTNAKHEILRESDRIVAAQGGFPPLLEQGSRPSVAEQVLLSQQLHQRIGRLQQYGAFAFLPDELGRTSEEVITLPQLAPLLLAQSAPYAKGAALTVDERQELAQHAVRLKLALMHLMKSQQSDAEALKRWQEKVGQLPAAHLETLARQFDVQTVQMPLLLSTLENYQQQVTAQMAINEDRLRQYYQRFPGFYQRDQQWGLIVAQGPPDALNRLHRAVGDGPEATAEAMSSAKDWGLTLQEVMLTAVQMPPELRPILTALEVGTSHRVEKEGTTQTLWYCVKKFPPQKHPFEKVRSQLEMTLAGKQLQQAILKPLNLQLWTH